MVGDWAAGDPAGTNILTEAGIFDVVTANTVKMWCSASEFAAPSAPPPTSHGRFSSHTGHLLPVRGRRSARLRSRIDAHNTWTYNHT
jgi:hypothetical protein